MTMAWRRDKSKIYLTLKWLLFPMKCIGWYKDPFTKKRTRFFQFLSFGFCAIIFLGCLTVMGYSMYFKKNPTATNITGFISNFGNAAIFIFGFIYVPRRFHNFIIMCDQLKEKYKAYGTHTNIHVGIAVSAVAFVTFSSLYIIYMLYFAFDGFVKYYGSAFAYIGLSFGLLNLILFFFLRFVIMAMTHCLCWILRKESSVYCRELSKMVDTVPSESQIEEMKQRYIDIADLTEMADDMLCPLISMLLVLALVSICFLMNNVIMKEPGYLESTACLLLLVSDVYHVSFVLVQCCLLYGAIAVCILIPSKFNGSRITGSTMLLIETMKHRDCGLSFMKMFMLNKPSVLTVIGTLVTYVIVVIQFQPV